MSAQPVQEHDPDDPVEILRVLPERFRVTPFLMPVPDWPARVNRR